LDEFFNAKVKLLSLSSSAAVGHINL